MLPACARNQDLYSKRNYRVSSGAQAGSVRYVRSNRFRKQVSSMIRFTSFILVIVLSFSCLTASAETRFQKATPVNREKLAAQVREEFLHAWNDYKQYAWGHDDLRPLTKTYRDWYGQSLLMTPVDALDTMILMGLKDEAEKTK